MATFFPGGEKFVCCKLVECIHRPSQRSVDKGMYDPRCVPCEHFNRNEYQVKFEKEVKNNVHKN